MALAERAAAFHIPRCQPRSMQSMDVPRRVIGKVGPGISLVSTHPVNPGCTAILLHEAPGHSEIPFDSSQCCPGEVDGRWTIDDGSMARGGSNQCGTVIRLSIESADQQINKILTVALSRAPGQKYVFTMVGDGWQSV